MAGKLDTLVLQAEKAMRGLRNLTDASIRLILKLNKRKNPRGAVPPMRPRFCESDHFAPQRALPGPLFSALSSCSTAKVLADSVAPGIESQPDPQRCDN